VKASEQELCCEGLAYTAIFERRLAACETDMPKMPEIRIFSFAYPLILERRSDTPKFVVRRQDELTCVLPPPHLRPDERSA
jgi:hypothetical protein